MGSPRKTFFKKFLIHDSGLKAYRSLSGIVEILEPYLIFPAGLDIKEGGP